MQKARVFCAETFIIFWRAMDIPKWSGTSDWMEICMPGYDSLVTPSHISKEQKTNQPIAAFNIC